MSWAQSRFLLTSACFHGAGAAEEKIHCWRTVLPGYLGVGAS